MGIALFRDFEIRQSLNDGYLKKYINDKNSLVLNELGLMQGLCRVDIAVINGIIHGFEIKSDADTLERLPAQEKVYSQVLDKATLVVGESHLDKAKEIVPDWWGIKIVKSTKKQSLQIKSYRKESNNRNINAFALVQLLWKDEVIQILQKNSTISSKDFRKPKEQLYNMLSNIIPLKNLKDIVRVTLKQRTNWRYQKVPSPYADL